MTAPLKTVEGSDIAAPDARHRPPRQGRRARALALAPTAQKDEALAAMAAAIRARKADILAANAEDLAEAKASGATSGLPRPARARRQARRRDGRRARRGARARRSGRHGDRTLDAAERHDHRARARAARRRRHHLREPAERHRRCRRALPQGRQCRDPARRLGEPSLDARDPCRAGRGPCARPACRRPRSRSCRRATAPRSG